MYKSRRTICHERWSPVSLLPTPDKRKVDLNGHYIFQLALPKNKINDILHHYHDNRAGGGHFGIKRTFANIRMKYWLPHMYNTIKLCCFLQLMSTF